MTESGGETRQPPGATGRFLFSGSHSGWRPASVERKQVMNQQNNQNPSQQQREQQQREQPQREQQQREQQQRQRQRQNKKPGMPDQKPGQPQHSDQDNDES